MSFIKKSFSIGLVWAVFSILFFQGLAAFAENKPLEIVLQSVDNESEKVLPKVIEWRRDIHSNPELGNAEFRTSAKVAEHLKKLGYEVRTGLAKTGVVGVLKCAKPGKTVALRADMDALPVTEQTGLPFASKVKATYNGAEVGVMHACGHDMHTAMLMGVAEVLANNKNKLAGNIVLIFQPAEEGGEIGGAAVMIKEGAFDKPKTDAVFGLHVFPDYETGTIACKTGGVMAAVDNLSITVKGKQTHGAMPWMGVDPVLVSAQIITGLQSIVSRQIDLTVAPAIITVSMINGGIRSNIIPDTVKMAGTVRTLDENMRVTIRQKIKDTAEHIAEASNAEALVDVSGNLPVTYNNPELTSQIMPALERVVGKGNLLPANAKTTGEDFCYYAQKAPGVFFFLGVRPKNVSLQDAAPNHSPLFNPDEGALIYGVRAMASAAAEFLMKK